MSYRLRAARVDDIDSLLSLAELTGGGFTNLPPDRPTLSAKLDRAAACFARGDDTPGSDLYVFMLEHVATGAIHGTCQIFGAVGIERPFYSYLISTLTQKSEELGQIFRNRTLNLTTDLEGSSEVGGLFLHPDARSGGLGFLLARSRYLFIRSHRQRFGDTVLAELRGVLDEQGNSPFWDALGGRFFGMAFPEADEFNATHGTQFIADLFPKTPIYVAMLPDTAQAVIGAPHPSGQGALKMLESEGFVWDGYVDIFDGGPTVTARIDQIRTVREAGDFTIADTPARDGSAMLLSTGRLDQFRACFGLASDLGEGILAIDEDAMHLLDVRAGDSIQAVAR
jgi:arginine N-succinyltransferase